ncbi:MAG: histidine kinase, partial [Planctomycetota bacterium]
MRFLAYLLLLVSTSITGVVGLEFILEQVESSQLRREAERKCKTVVADLNARSALIRRFGSNFASGEVSEAAFLRNAIAFSPSTSFLAAEWLPRIEPEERAGFEHEIQQRLGRPNLVIRTQKSPLALSVPDKTVYPVRFTTKEHRHETVGVYRHHNQMMMQALRKPDEVIFSRQLPHTLGKSQPAYCCFMAVPSPKADSRSEGSEPDNTKPTVVGIVAVYFRDFVDPSIAVSGSTSIRALLHTTKSKPPIAIERDPQEAEGRLLVHHDFYLADHRFRLEARELPAAVHRRAALSWIGLILGPLVVCWALRSRLQKKADNLAAANIELTEEVTEQIESKRMLQSMLTLREQERRLMASEIHDGFIQEATSAQMYLEALAARLDPDDENTSNHLENSRKMIEMAISEGRQLIDGLRPRTVDQLGLIPALQNLIAKQQEQHRLSVALRYSPGMPELDIQIQRSLYRIVQESLSNVRKHSGVNEAIVSLHVDDERVTLDITDQGHGFEMDNAQEGFGLRGIQERAAVLGGEAIIKTVPDEGTSLSVSLP